jgi:hypothetical protein
MDKGNRHHRNEVYGSNRRLPLRPARDAAGVLVGPAWGAASLPSLGSRHLFPSNVGASLALLLAPGAHCHQQRFVLFLYCGHLVVGWPPTTPASPVLVRLAPISHSNLNIFCYCSIRAFFFLNCWYFYVGLGAIQRFT